MLAQCCTVALDHTEPAGWRVLANNRNGEETIRHSGNDMQTVVAHAVDTAEPVAKSQRGKGWHDLAEIAGHAEKLGI